MLRKILSVTIFSCLSATATSHEIELQLPSEATQEDIELQRFCRMKSAVEAAFDPNCAEAIEAFGGKEIVAQCVDQFLNYKVDPKTLQYLHQTGGGLGLWHRHYEKTDEKSPAHRYDYTESARELAGVTLGRQFADNIMRSGKPDTAVTTGSSSEASSSTTGIVTAGRVVGAELSGERGQSSSRSGSTTVKGPTQSELDTAYARGYGKGYQQPDLVGMKPDMYCEKGKATCQTSSGDVVNRYPDSNPPPVKQPDAAIREDGERIPIKSEPPKFNPPRTGSLAPVKIEYPDSGVKHAGQWAGSPTINPDEKWANVIPAETREQDPIEACITKKMTKKFEAEKDIHVADWGDSASPEQKKATNEKLLSIGFCDSSYWGNDYCAWYNNKVHNFNVGNAADGTVKVETSNQVVNPIRPRKQLSDYATFTEPELNPTPITEEDLANNTIKRPKPSLSRP